MRSLKYMSILLGDLASCVAVSKNSTFQNPIISGFHPDPSCIFVPEFNETFFCVTSSFLVFPGLPIYASQDLVHWKHISNSFSRADQLPGLAFLPKATSGIYAPTLRYHNGKFYVMSTLVNQQAPRNNDSRWDNFLVTSTDPYKSDAWSDPMHFNFPGFDPSPFWDSDGKTWVSGAHTAAYYPGVMHAPLDLDTGEIGNIIMPWNGTGGASPEGPHIWKRDDGLYYQLIAEGGTRENHMVTMARAKTIQGPWEPAPGNPLLTSANDTTSYFQAVGHADLFQDSNGNWWACALAVRAGGSYGRDPGPYFGNLPMGREAVLTSVTWNEGEFPIFDPIRGNMTGWPLPPASIPEQGEGQLTDADDNINFPPGSTLPIHFIHWRLPKPRNYIVSPPERPNTLMLRSSVLNLTGFDGDYALGRGQTFIGRRMAHSIFKFAVDVELGKSFNKEEMEVGVSMIQDQAQHFDIGVVLLSKGHYGRENDSYTTNDYGNDWENNAEQLKAYIRFRGHSETMYRGRTDVPTEILEIPPAWAGLKLTLLIEAVNTTHFSFSAGPASRSEENKSELRILGYCRGNDLVPYYSGVVVGTYATSNGKHGEQAFEAYLSNWRYWGIRQLRSHEDVEITDSNLVGHH